MNPSVHTFTRRSPWLFLLIVLLFKATQLHAQSPSTILNFDSSTFVDTQFANSGTGGPQEYSIEVWVKPGQAEERGDLLALQADAKVIYTFTLRNISGTGPGHYVHFLRSSTNQAVIASPIALDPNQWTLLTICRTATQWSLYKNGTLAYDQVDTARRPVNRVQIGSQFKGQIAQIRIWSSRLEPAFIRRNMRDSLAGNEPGLIGLFDLFRIGNDSLRVPNRSGNSSALKPATLRAPHFRASVGRGVLPFETFKAFPLTLDNGPRNLQFFPRDTQDSAYIEFSGSLRDATAPHTLQLEVRRNDSVMLEKVVTIRESGTPQSFALGANVHAELSQYTYRLYEVRGDNRSLEYEAADLVVGDAYLICGQSNSHPSNAAVTYVNPYLRTLGIQTTNSNFDPYNANDTCWGYANAHGNGQYFTGPYLTGVWGLRMQQRLSERYQLPICVINGGAGASTIEQNLRNDANPMDLRTIYGRTLYRVQVAGLQNAIKAIFWHQGESNTLANYYLNFHKIYNAWAQDYPRYQHLYLFQVRPSWCGAGATGSLRNLQRTLGDSLPNVSVMSTIGLLGHAGCHYDSSGYFAMAESILPLVERDFYGSSDTINILPPQIKEILYSTPAQDEISIVFTAHNLGLHARADTIVHDTLEQLQNYLYLDGVPGAVKSWKIVEDTIKLQLDSTHHAATLSYCPEQYYNRRQVVFEGPVWLNARGIGVFTFDHVPIAPYKHDSEVSSTSARIMRAWITPNPAHTMPTLHLILREAEDLEFSLVSTTGRVLANISRHFPNNGQFDVPLDFVTDTLPAGPYYLRLHGTGARQTIGITKF